MRPPSTKISGYDLDSTPIFPKHLLQIGYTTNANGYGPNDFFSKRPLPVFWGGDIKIAQGFSVNYQHLLYHGRKVFSFSAGGNFSYWKSGINKEHFYTISLF